MAGTQPDQFDCAECGVILRPGDGAIGAFGRRFCSEECADEYENRMSDPRDVFEGRVDYYGSV